MPTYSANDIIGKTLFAKTVVNLRKAANTSAEVVGQTQPGMAVGVVFSWVEQPDGLWWQIQRPAGAAVWAKHQQGWFDTKALTDQGVRTRAEKTKEAEQANKSVGDKLLEMIQKGGKTLAFVGVGLLAYKFWSQKKKS